MSRVFPPPEPPPPAHTVCTPRITLRQLNRRGACLAEVTLFRMRFGREVEVTVEACVDHCNDFDFEWATTELLHEEHCAEVEEAVARRILGRPKDLAFYQRVLAEEFAKTYREVYPNVP